MADRFQAPVPNVPLLAGLLHKDGAHGLSLRVWSPESKNWTAFTSASYRLKRKTCCFLIINPPTSRVINVNSTTALLYRAPGCLKKCGYGKGFLILQVGTFT